MSHKKLERLKKIYLERMSDLKDDSFSPDANYPEFAKRLEQKPAPSFLPESILKPALAVCLVFTLIGGGLFVYTAKDAPKVSVLQGDTNVKLDQKLNTSDKVVTGQADWAIIEIRNKYRLKVQPNSILHIRRLKSSYLPGEALFHLSKGEVLIQIGQNDGKKYPLEVQTQNAFAKAAGTQFMVMAPTVTAPQSYVGVLQGSVQVGHMLNGQRITKSMVSVTKDHEVYVEEASSTLSPRAIVYAKRRRLQEPFQFGAKNRIILLMGMGPNRVDELLKPCRLYLQVSKENKEYQNIKSTLKQMRMALKMKDRRQHVRAAKNFEAAIEAQNGLDRVSGLLFVGAHHYYLGHNEEAVRIFEKIASQYKESSLRSLAMIASAKIYREELGNTPKAQAIEDQILRDHPQSPETQRLFLLR